MKRDFLVLYDIADPKRLRKVAKFLESEGVRVQKSLFECNWEEGYDIIIKHRLRELIDLANDYILLIPRCSTDLQKEIKIGRGSAIKVDTLPYKIL